MAKSPLLPHRVGDTLIVGIDPAKLRKAREDAGRTQEGLAAGIGMHAQYISQLERGVKRPAYGTVTALADALGVTVTDICVTVPVTDLGGAA